MPLPGSDSSLTIASIKQAEAERCAGWVNYDEGNTKP